MRKGGQQRQGAIALSRRWGGAAAVWEGACLQGVGWWSVSGKGPSRSRRGRAAARVQALRIAGAAATCRRAPAAFRCTPAAGAAPCTHSCGRPPPLTLLSTRARVVKSQAAASRQAFAPASPQPQRNDRWLACLPAASAGGQEPGGLLPPGARGDRGAAVPQHPRRPRRPPPHRAPQGAPARARVLPPPLPPPPLPPPLPALPPPLPPAQRLGRRWCAQGSMACAWRPQTRMTPERCMPAAPSGTAFAPPWCPAGLLPVPQPPVPRL